MRDFRFFQSLEICNVGSLKDRSHLGYIYHLANLTHTGLNSSQNLCFYFNFTFTLFLGLGNSLTYISYCCSTIANSKSTILGSTTVLVWQDSLCYLHLHFAGVIVQVLLFDQKGSQPKLKSICDCLDWFAFVITHHCFVFF